MNIFDGVNSLQQGVAASWKRNSVILDNVANNDTPDFKASHVEFESLYKEALQSEEEGGFRHTRTVSYTHLHDDLRPGEGSVYAAQRCDRNGYGGFRIQ